MTNTRTHYDELLGPVYSWMVGDLDTARRRNAELFDRLELRPAARSTAVDLGCGHGIAALVLADRGYDVVAIDFCRALLDELAAARGGRSIEIVAADMLDFAQHVAVPAHLVVCLGDTLTHLPDAGAVERMLRDVAAALAPGGTFVATFRDYVTRELEGEARFIPVKSSADRILTCMLEYAPETVRVHDLLHVRDGDLWRLHVSSYTKLRLDPAHLAGVARAAGLDVRESTVREGLVTFVADKP